MTHLRKRLAWGTLAVCAGLNLWLWWPETWLPTPEAAVLRAGGTVKALTRPDAKGRLAVVLPATVTDEGVEQMTALDRLAPVWLQVEGPGITNRGLASLTRLKDVRGLLLRRTKVDDEGLRRLADFPDLESLNLDGSPITDRGLELIQSLPHLQGVSLYGTKVTKEGVKKLLAARPGLRLNSDHTEEDD
jgi:hypothetical protein